MHFKVIPPLDIDKKSNYFTCFLEKIGTAIQQKICFLKSNLDMVYSFWIPNNFQLAFKNLWGSKILVVVSLASFS